MSDWISLELRNFVRQRARGRCEYCQLHEDDTGLRHQPDHIVALKHRGATIESNLAYSCACASDLAMCNSFKGTDLSSIDPTTGTLVRLFNPRIDDWSSHFEVIGGRILGRTPEGRVTVELLQMNRPDLVQLRRLLAAVGRSSKS